MLFRPCGYPHLPAAWVERIHLPKRGKMSCTQTQKILGALTLVLGVLLVIAPAANAATINIPQDYPTIQAGIAAASDGDTVQVAPGTYVENIDFLNKAISVVSSAGPAVTVIDGNNQGSAVTINNGAGRFSVQQVLQGFTLRNGNGDFGGGVAVAEASPTILGNIFDSNNAPIGYFGSGIGVWSASPLIEQNTFRNNTCDNQGEDAVVSVFNNSSPLIFNNIFVDNPCRAIGFVSPSGTSPRVANNTIVGNSAGISTWNPAYSILHLYKNNIIVGNNIGFEVESGTLPSDTIWQNNLVYGNVTNYSGVSNQTGINGNISADPLFFDPANNDYHLCLGSPAIDAGDPTGLTLPATDFDGNPRVIGGMIDIGAYEFDPNAPPRVTFVADTVSGGAPLSVQFTSRTTTSVTSYLWDFGDGTSSTEADPVHSFGLGTYTVSLTVSGPTGTGAATRTNLITALPVYTITASAGVEGTIAPPDSSTVTEDGSLTYSVTVNDPTQYYLAALVVDGTNVGELYQYTFNSVVSDHTITAVFASYPVITASAGAGGQITPPGATTVNTLGGSLTYTVTPNPSYQLASLTVDGTTVDGPSPFPLTYTFSGIESDHTITAVFTRFDDYFGIQAGNQMGLSETSASGSSQTGTADISFDTTSFSSPSYVDQGAFAGSVTNTWYQSVSNGLFMLQQTSSGETLTYEPALPVIKTPLTAGERWTASSTVFLYGVPVTATITAAVSPQVLVSVPAGHFMAWPIAYRLTASVRGRTSATAWTDWFVPYVGFIKERDQNAATTQLTSFAVGGGTTTTPPPVVTGTVPKSAACGSTISINGFQFGASQGDSKVMIGNVECDQIVSWSDTQIACTIPATAVSGAVTVVTDIWTSNNSITLIIPPEITGVTPSSGQRGSTVQILGTAFGTVAGKVNLGTVPAHVTQWGDNSITCTVPASMPYAAFPVTVINSQGQKSVLQRAFTVVRQ